ncbi:SDR family NAD(P)-dependent oxidoreductase [Microscilla marina]|nr:SDR family oxidoreductase [Microscilla marina]
MKEKYGFSEADWNSCIKVLEVLKDNPFHNPDNQRFGTLVTKIHKQAKKQRKQAPANARKTNDMATLQQTTIARNALANKTLFAHQVNPKTAHPVYTPLHTSRNCYSCNTPYQKAHPFYHRLCPACAELNYTCRSLAPDLRGRKVILTGGRVKIGYAAALKLLRCGAELTLTTRFPALALEQLQQEKDYTQWQHRLHIYGLDLRNLSAVQAFIERYCAQHKHLDILINNAAQTIRYDQAYYTPLLAKEQQLLPQYHQQLVANTTPVLDEVPALLESLPAATQALTRFGQPVDVREKNSWNSTLAEIPVNELLEVNLINHIAPYMLIKGFTPLLKASAYAEKLIINVSSSEGQFSYGNKTRFHPHTNMTKAALNMLTRTSAQEYAQYQVFINSVDVGWVSTGVRESLRQKQFEAGQIPPLDPVDGAARIIHPIYEAITNKHFLFGNLLKNYKIEEW